MKYNNSTEVSQGHIFSPESLSLFTIYSLNLRIYSTTGVGCGRFIWKSLNPLKLLFVTTSGCKVGRIKKFTLNSLGKKKKKWFLDWYNWNVQEDVWLHTQTWLDLEPQYHHQDQCSPTNDLLYLPFPPHPSSNCWLKFHLHCQYLRHTISEAYI